MTTWTTADRIVTVEVITVTMFGRDDLAIPVEQFRVLAHGQQSGYVCDDLHTVRDLAHRLNDLGYRLSDLHE